MTVNIGWIGCGNRYGVLHRPRGAADELARQISAPPPACSANI